MPVSWIWILLLGFVLFLFFLLFSRIYFTCHFTYTQQKQVLIIGIYFYRLRLLRREIDLSSNENEATWDIWTEDRKSTCLNSSHVAISYAVFCLKKKLN